jgi:HlyD family secretion protein
LKIALIIVGLLAVLAVVGTAVVVSVAPEGVKRILSPEPTRTTVRSQKVIERQLVESVAAPGEIEPLTKVDISAEVSARIEELPVRDGDVVRRGDVIVKLDDRLLRSELDAVKAQREGERFRLQSEQASLAGTLKHLEFAKRNLARQQQLLDSGDISQSAFDEAQDRVDELEASAAASAHMISVIESSLAAAEANIERAQDSLTKTVIRSPLDGLVTKLNAEVGEVVLLGTMNNPGTVIMTVADLSRMLLKARVAESDVAKVAQSQTARIHINAYPKEVFSGVVRRIALQRTVVQIQETGYFEVEIEIELQGRQIFSGLVANVDIEIAAHQGFAIESQAIVERKVDDLPKAVRDDPLVDTRKQVANVVYRIVDGKAACTPVRAGPSDLTHTLVEAGLGPGDEVIVGPYKVLETIKQDQLVTTEAERPPSAAAPKPASG